MLESSWLYLMEDKVEISVEQTGDKVEVFQEEATHDYLDVSRWNGCYGRDLGSEINGSRIRNGINDIGSRTYILGSRI